jgi:multidrug efflux pump subunit AcrB
MAALWVSGYAFGFSAILGLVALIGISINDSIVVHSAIKADPDAAKGDIGAIKSVVVRATRHVLATSITTMAGFLPLLFSASNIWPPMAVTIGFGVAGATILALFFTPCAYILLNKIEIIDLNDNSDESSSYSNMKPA